MIRRICGMLLLLAVLPLAGGCGDNSEVFYSVSYPIVRIGAEVSLSATESTPEQPSSGEGTESGEGDGTESGTDSGSGTETQPGTGNNAGSEGAGTGAGTGGGADSGSEEVVGAGEGTEEGDEEEPVDPLIAQIQAEVAAEAPVQPGGRYSLDFTAYNSGPLTVDTATDEGVTQGAFIKEPGASQITILYLNRVYDCTISSYTDTDGVRKVMLSIDLTEEFQMRYPEAGITKVVRNEYSSTPTY